MPLFSRVFKSRKRKQEAVPNAETAIDNLKEMEEMLIKKQLHYEEKIANELANARKYGKRQERQAMAALRRKKLLETELTKIDGVLMKIECQRTALENAGQDANVLSVLEQTTKALRVANQNLDIDKVNDIMDSIRDGLDDADELAAAISRPIADRPDEDELMDELMELEKEDDKLPSLPEVPRGRMITRSMSKDCDIEQLQAWAQ